MERKRRLWFGEFRLTEDVCLFISIVYGGDVGFDMIFGERIMKWRIWDLL